MTNSYIQAYVHYIFAVKGKINFIKQEHNNILQKYITGIVQNSNCKMLAINNMPDHVHILTGQHPSYSISKTIQEIKSISSKFTNEKNWYKSKFFWLSGYGAFTYFRSQINTVVKYIINQQNHHKKKTFKDEYIEFINKSPNFRSGLQRENFYGIIFYSVMY